MQAKLAKSKKTVAKQSLFFRQIYVKRYSCRALVAMQTNLSTLPFVCQHNAIGLLWRFGRWWRFVAFIASIFVHLLVQKPITMATFHILLYVFKQNFVKTLEKLTKVYYNDINSG